MTLSDETLVQHTREGDNGAFTTLWQRHSKAAHWAASAIPGSHDPEDVVQESFTRLLEGLKNADENPIDGPFRQYLYVVIRQVAESSDTQASLPIPFQPALFAPDDLDTSVADHALISLAYESLSKEWKTILWYTEVEQLTAAEISPFLGISPNAVSALAYRAREGLRSAWLQAHIRSTTINSVCETTISQLGNYVRGSLGPRKCAKIQSHVRTCTSCNALLDELNSVSRSLRANALFAVIGVLGLSATCGKTASAMGVATAGVSTATAGTLTAVEGGTGVSSGGIVGASTASKPLVVSALLPSVATSTSISAGIIGLSVTGLAASVVVGATFMFGNHSPESTPSADSPVASAQASPQPTAPSAQHSRGFFGHSARFVANSSDEQDAVDPFATSIPPNFGGYNDLPETLDFTEASPGHSNFEPKSNATPSMSQAEPKKNSESKDNREDESGEKTPTKDSTPKDPVSASPTGTAGGGNTDPKSSAEEKTGAASPENSKPFVVFQSNMESSGPPYFAGQGPQNVDVFVEDEFGNPVGSVRTGADSNWSLRVIDTYSSRGKNEMNYQFYIVDSTGNRTHVARLRVSQLVA